MPVADTQLQNLIKITKVRKESNYEPYWRLREPYCNYESYWRRLCLQQPAPACGVTHVPSLHCTAIGFALDWESHKSLKHTELLERAIFNHTRFSESN